MRIKKVLILLFVIFITLSMLTNFSYAEPGEGQGRGIDGILSGMEGISNIESEQGSNIANVIRHVIFLIQVAGTGISLIVITMLGIKYIIASVEEKAEVKKQIMPLLIGCILLFGAVNIMAAVYSFTTKALGSGGGGTPSN